MDAEALGDAGPAGAIEARYPDGAATRKDMWTYWRLLEGEVYVDAALSHGGRPRSAGAARRADEHAGRSTAAPAASWPIISTSTGRTAPSGWTARRAGRHDSDQDRPERRHRSLRTRQRRIPGRAGVRRLPHFGDGPAHDPLRGLAQAFPRSPQRRHRRVHARQRADLRLDHAERLHDRRQQSRLQDDRRRQAGGEACWRAATASPSCSRSPSTASPTGRTFGASNSHCPWV